MSMEDTPLNRLLVEDQFSRATAEKTLGSLEGFLKVMDEAGPPDSIHDLAFRCLLERCVVLLHACDPALVSLLDRKIDERAALMAEQLKSQGFTVQPSNVTR